jgi:hypothetical protein
MLFTDRSIQTMIHGIGLAGAALLALGAALFSLYAIRTAADGPPISDHTSRSVVWLLVAAAAALWLVVISGTYVIFPPYRATPPEGVTDLASYPRAMILADPDTAWLHSFAMETKEHVPWIAAMLATAVAFVGVRYRAVLFGDAALRRPTMLLLTLCLALVSAVGLLGIFVNKVAPLQ